MSGAERRLAWRLAWRLLGVAAVAALVGLVGPGACAGGGEPTPPTPSSPPRIVLSPTTTAFSGTAGVAMPAFSVQVTNGGDGALAGITASTNRAWLGAVARAATAPTSIDISVSSAGMAAGSYDGVVTVASNTAGVANSPQTIAVTVTLAPAQTASLTLSPTSLDFGTVEQNAAVPAERVVQVSASGGALGTIAVSGVPTWLRDSVDQATQRIVLRPASTATAGTFTGTLTVTATGAAGASASLPVQFAVTAAPRIVLTPNSVAFPDTPVGGDLPGAQAVQVTNGGGGSLGTLSLSSVPAWLDASLAGTTITLRPASTATAGSYSGDVAVASTTPGVAPATLPVSFNVTGTAPRIVLTPTSVAFGSVQQNAPRPAARTVQVTNGGGGSLGTLSLQGVPAWLTASVSGTTITLQPASTATAGTFAATITVNSSTAGVAPASLPVSFTVTAPAPVIVLTPTSVSFGTVQLNAALPAQQTVQVTNGGGGSLGTLSLSTVPAWLDASITGTTITLQPKSTATAGSYSATVTVNSSTAGVAPASLPVSYTVAEPAPVIVLTPSSVSFGTVAQGAPLPAQQQVQVSNGGGGSLGTLSLTNVPGWLTASVSGTTITLRPASTATAGTFSATITVNSSTAGVAPASLPVSFTVTAPAPVIVLTPTSVSFGTVAQNGALPAAQQVQVSNGGGGSLGTISLTNVPAWVNASVSGLTITLQPTSTATAGTFSGTITVNSSTAGVAPASLPVSFTVTAPPPVIVLTPTSVSFGTVQQNAALPAAQSVQVSNGGGGSLGTLSLSGIPAWVNASISGSTITVQPKSTATVGVYSGTITVNSSTAGVSPASLPVSFTVQVATYTLSVGPPSDPNSGLLWQSSTSITSSPTGINCGFAFNIEATGSDPRKVSYAPGAVCSAPFNGGTTVTLTAVTSGGGIVWEGCDSVDAQQRCIVTMNANRSVVFRNF